jgi:4,5-DOPA dioxygenase extradiol
MDNQEAGQSGANRMPVLFVGHGSPMNAIEENAWSRGFRALDALLPRPRAILCVSAHWYVSGTFLTGNAQPKTIHDFGGFPRSLYEIQYPASGHIDLAKQVMQLIGEDRASLRDDWGLDHGTWSVLLHVFPKADIPVVQLSISQNLSAQRHLDIGRTLAPLREQGVLVMGSGNIVHNLHHAMTAYRSGDLVTPTWAAGFDADIARAIEQHDDNFLVRALDTDTGRMSHPTPEHFLPLLYVMGAVDKDESVRFPISGFDLSSLSMRTALIG